MQMKRSKKLSSFILCMALTVAMALSVTGCNGKTNQEASSPTGSETGAQTEDHVLGEGSTSFTFTVTDQEGTETEFEIHTDQETVGDALTELGLIAGEESDYGLYVKTVNGVTLDYDADGAYWAFYVNGEYAQTGVDATTITEGDAYSFKAEK